MLLSLNKVEGHSMEPKLKNGSFFIASNIPYLFFEPKVNDIIVFNFKEKIIVKQIVKIEKEKYLTKGINKSDSKNYPPILRKEILGKVIWCL